MEGKENSLKISPALFFEVLLRKALNELRKVNYTVERTCNLKIPVFDVEDVSDILKRESLLIYLAHMLGSFTKIETFSISFRLKNGTWTKFQLNDLDIHSLKSLSDVVEDKYKLSFYKRIADTCLFTLGMFPDFVDRNSSHPHSGESRPIINGRAVRFSPDKYEEEGRKYYKMAAEHQSAKRMSLDDVFWALHENFQVAKKPLSLIAENYLQCPMSHLFI
jgi:hypothetical protein